MEWVTGRKSEISFSHDGKILTGKYTPPRRPISVPVTQLIGSPLLNTIIKAEDNSPKLLNVMIVKINIIMDDKKFIFVKSTPNKIIPKRMKRKYPTPVGYFVIARK